MYQVDCPEVLEIGEINFEGNIIPHTWFQHLTFSSGAPDLPAILILSEIVYWFRPVIERDPNTLEVKGIKQKFEGDALRISKQVLARRFNLSERQVKDALRRLEERGLIVREVRTVELPRGVKQNQLFVKPVPEAIKEITYPFKHFAGERT